MTSGGQQRAEAGSAVHADCGLHSSHTQASTHARAPPSYAGAHTRCSIPFAQHAKTHDLGAPTARAAPLLIPAAPLLLPSLSQHPKGARPHIYPRHGEHEAVAAQVRDLFWIQHEVLLHRQRHVGLQRLGAGHDL